MENFKVLSAIVLCCAISACGKNSGTGGSPALTPGVYNLGGPICFSTGKTPDYPDAAHSLNLFDFVDATKHTLAIKDFTSTRTISTGSCTLTVTQPVRTNFNGSFIQMQTRTSSFAPQGCMLKVAAKGQIFEVGQSSSNVFSERDSDDLDLPYEIVASADNPKALTMLSQDIDALNVLWSAYGCAESDRLKWTLTPVD